jgi:hypothetical protein
MSLNFKTKAKLQILRVEGLTCDEKSLGCYILLNNTLSDVITPLFISDSPNPSIQKSEINRVSMPSEGDLKLVLKLMKGDPVFMGSVSVRIQSLPSQGCLWLPLSSSLENDSFHNFSAPVSGPRILVALNKPAPSVDSSHLYKLQIKKLEFLVRQLEERVTDSSRFLQQEKEARTTLAVAYEHLQEHYTEVVDRAQDRENSMLALLQQKDVELQRSIAKSKELGMACETLKAQNQSLMDWKKGKEALGLERQAREMSKEISELKGVIEEKTRK